MTSPDRVFLVGAPRSGTTWLQQMLGAHPAIASPQETDLFDAYLAPWRAAWDAQLPGDPEEWRRRRHKGLPAVLTEQALDSLMRSVVARVHAEVLARKPGAHVVLEKVPGYAFVAPLILRLCPDARFVHLVRDGRDVAASMVGAARGWGRSWAPASAGAAAARWREHVAAARSIAALTPGYAEVRYERLLGSAPAELERLFAFCGVEASPADCAEIAARFAGRDAPSSLVWGGEVLARVGGAPAEPDGFFGERTAGLSRWERLAVEQEAGPLLRELGYERDAGGRLAGALLRLGWAAASRVARVRTRSAAAIGWR